MKKRFAILIAAIMTFSLAVQPGMVFGASDTQDSAAGEWASEAVSPFSDIPGDGENADPADGEGNPEYIIDGGGNEAPLVKPPGTLGSDGGLAPFGIDEDKDAAAGGEPLDPIDALEAIEELTIDAGPDADYDGYLVLVKPGEITEEMIEAAPSEPLEGGIFVVDAPEEALEFAEPDQIEVIEPNYILQAFDFPQTAPNDPDYKDQLQWNLNGTYGVNAPGAWGRGVSGAGVRIGVLDSGINALHQDFRDPYTNAPIVREGYKFDGGSGQPLATIAADGYAAVSDGYGHGSMVSGIIAAVTNNGLNIAGLAYGAEIVPFKVLNDAGVGNLGYLMAALNYISSHNSELRLSVVNISLGAHFDVPSPTLQASVDGLTSKGIIVVAAVGNGLKNEATGQYDYTALMYPAACEGVIGVASIGKGGSKSSFSTYNKSVDVAAPGESIYGINNNNNTGSRSGQGTSYAAPLVAAAAALVKELKPSTDSAEFMELLEATSVPRLGGGKTNEYGFGLLDVQEMMGCYYQYTVMHRYDGVVDGSLTELNCMFCTDGSPILTLSDVRHDRPGYSVSGYTLNETPLGAGETAAAIGDGDVLVVDYYSDYDLVYEYSVDYEYGGDIDAAGRETQYVWRGAPTVYPEDIAQKPKAGYEFSGTVPELPAEVADGQTITAVYTVDESQAVGYSVRYLYDGVADTGRGESLSAWLGNPVAPAPDVSANSKPGYVFDGFSLNGEPVGAGDFPVPVNEGDVIDLDYSSDYSLVCNYYIKYRYGSAIDETVSETHQVWAGNPVVTSGDVARKDRPGYVFTGINVALPAIVSDGQTITVSYAEDRTQTVSYEVRYLYEGETDAGLTEQHTLWAGDAILKEGDIVKKPRPGYTFDTYKLNGGELTAGSFPIKIADGDVIELCYVPLGGVYENGNWYIYGAGGELLTGWVGNQYFFAAADGQVTGSRASGCVYVPGRGSGTKRWCYFDPASGDVVTGLVRIGSYDYYFRGEAGMAAGCEISIDRRSGQETGETDLRYIAVYRFDDNGRAITGWRTDADGKRYYDKDGRAAGAKKIGSYFYFFDRVSGLMKNTSGMVQDSVAEGAWYYCYSANGYLRTGKFTASSKTYYADKKTAALFTGQVKDGSYYYWYEGDKGRLGSVERQAGGKLWFYKADGKRASGWVTWTSAMETGTYAQGCHMPGDKVYYHSKNGLLTGLQKIGSYRYWLDPKKNGAVYRTIGWIPDPEYTYYCYSTNGYIRVGGEQEIGLTKLYFGPDGKLASGPVKVGSYLYYFNGGIKVTLGESAWYKAADGKWYYITAPQGRLKTGKFTDMNPNPATVAPGVQRYLSKTTGEAVTGRVKDGSYHYYYDGIGGLVTAPGWLERGGKTYYVGGTGGRLKTGQFADPATGVRHWFDKSNAALFTGQVKIGNYYYYFEAEGRAGLVLGGERCVTDKKGKEYTFLYRVGDGRRVSGWVTFNAQSAAASMAAMALPAGGGHADGDRVYYHSSKGLLTGVQKISSRWYWLDAGRNGAMFRYTGGDGGQAIEVKDPLSEAIKMYYCDSPNGYLKTGRFTAKFGKSAGVSDRNSWYSEDARTYYADSRTAALVTGPVRIGSYYYYYDSSAYSLVKSDGTAAAWIMGGGKRYCTTRTDGRLKTGSALIDGNQYYFSGKGEMFANGEKKLSGKWYFYGEEGIRAKSVWVDMPDGRMVYYGANGARYAGEKKVSAVGLDGSPIKDEQGNYTYIYYFDKNTGARKTGWLTLSKKTYYHDPAWPAAQNVYVDGRVVHLVVPGARAMGEWTDASGKEVYLNPATGVLVTGQVKLAKEYPAGSGSVKDYYFYFDGKNGKLLGGEKKVGSYSYYFRAPGEDKGFVVSGDGKTLLAGFADDPVAGPAGSRVKGWWKMAGGDLKFFSQTASSEGRRLYGRQQLPRYNYQPPAAYNPAVVAFYFLDASNGTIRRSDFGVYNGYIWETNEFGELTKWASVGNVMRGVDVSYWNGTGIDWKQARASGVQFVIARAGYTTIDSKKFEIDSTFAGNVKRARAAGLYVGAYIYVYSRSTSELNAAIDKFANEMAANGISPSSLDLPVFLDIEDSKYFLPSTNSLGGNSYRTGMIRSGLKRLESKGYKAGFYASLSWANNYFDTKSLSNEGYSFWLANWYGNNAELDPYTASWNGDFPAVWQYRSTGRAPGFGSQDVDMNYLYSKRVQWA